jgi:hypothetical protein
MQTKILSTPEFRVLFKRAIFHLKSGQVRRSAERIAPKRLRLFISHSQNFNLNLFIGIRLSTFMDEPLRNYGVKT